MAKPTLEFFTALIRNSYTRRAYARAASRFAAWCADCLRVDHAQVERI